MMAQVNAGRVRFVGRGEYNNSTQYYVFDLVNYNGNSYYAKVDTIGHLPTDTTYWQLVAEKGNVGPIGLTGNGISTITKTSTTGLVDTYTITYTNGNTTTFNVSNGNGIDRIEKTATVGNKDTYTIYFTNGSTTTYEVSNGEVTREELQEEVERLSMIYNAFPTTTGEGEEPSINGTAEVPFKEIGLKGNTSQSILPSGYTQVDYITSDGNSYIDTGKALGYNFKIETKFIYNQQSSNEQPIVSTWGNNSYAWFNLYIASNNQLRFYAAGNHMTANPTLTIGNINTVSYSRNDNEWVGTLNGEEVTFSTTLTASNPTTLKILARGDNTLGSYVSIYRLKLFENNILTMDLVPCYRNSDNVIGLYDIVNNQFLTNAGTGTFTYGSIAPNPDYPYPVNVVTGDNEVKVEGKNLMPFTNQDFTLNNVRYYVENGSLILNGTSTGETSSVNTTFKTNLSFTLPSGTYTISHKTGIMACYLYKTDNTLVKQVNTNVASETFTLSEKTQVFLGFYVYQKTFANINAEVMIEKGTSSSEYKPYQSQTYPINLGTMELCKIGDYQDYIARSTGKNLLDENYYNDGSLYTKSGAYFAFVELPDSFKTKFYVNMSLKGTNQSLVFGFTDNINGVFSDGIRVLDNGTINSNVECDFTNAENVYLAVGNSQMVNAERDVPKIFDNYNIMVSKTSGEPYEPYGKVWYKYGAIGNVVLDGSEEGWSRTGATATNVFQLEITLDYLRTSALTCICDNFTSIINTGYLYVNNGQCCFRYNSGDTNKRLYFGTDLYSQSSDFKTWLSTHNTTVYYILNTPTITEITDTTLIEQLDNLEKAYSYDTQTNISQTNQDKPFIISYEAILSLRNVLNS